VLNVVCIVSSDVNQKENNSMRKMNDVVIRYLVIRTEKEGKEDVVLSCKHSRSDANGFKRNISKKDLPSGVLKRELSVLKYCFTGVAFGFKRCFRSPYVCSGFRGMDFFIDKKTPDFDVNDLEHDFEVGMAFDWINGFTVDDIEEEIGLEAWF